MSLYFDISRYRCPNCKQVIAVNQIQDFSTRFGKREVFNCPHCGTKLNWAKLPHHIAHYSMWAAFITFPLPLTGLYSYQTGTWVLLTFLVMSAVGMMKQKLVINDGI